MICFEMPKQFRFCGPDLAPELAEKQLIVKAQNWHKPFVESNAFATLLVMFISFNAQTIGTALNVDLPLDELLKPSQMLAAGFYAFVWHSHHAY